jgi:hypothetical protein
MAEKTMTLILLRADRELWDGVPARLKVTDVSRSDLKVLYNKPLAPGSHTVLMNLDLLFNAGQVYGITVGAKRHRSAWQLINRRTFIRQQGGVEVEVKDSFLRLMLVPRKATSSDLDAGYDRLRERGSPMVAEKTGLSREHYLDLKPAAKMALLNIEAKLRETRHNGIPLLSFVEAVRYVKVDRVFLFMRAELKELIESSSEFAGAPGHEAPDDTPVELPAHPDSWKHQRFGAGNLQLSFSKNAEALPANPDRQVFSVDADIDLERGLGHVFEWLDNQLLHPGKKTDQTQVYSLLFSQGILTDYRLDPLSESD